MPTRIRVIQVAYCRVERRRKIIIAFIESINSGEHIALFFCSKKHLYKEIIKSNVGTCAFETYVIVFPFW